MPAIDVLKLLSVVETLEKASTFAISEGGKKEIRESKIISEKELPYVLEELKEADDSISSKGDFPLFRGNDLYPYILLAEKGKVLDEKELYSLGELIEVANKAKRYLLSDPVYPKLGDLGARISDEKTLAERIFKTISPSLDVLSSASKKLASIRKDIEITKREIERITPVLLGRYASYLSDMTIALKNGHYALPVSSSYKHLVHGLVQDISSSENTIFIEPEELLEKDNALAELLAEERVEIARILRELTGIVAEHSSELKTNASILNHLDALEAKILFGQSLNGHIASLSNDGSLFLPQAFHPLLDVPKIIKNDFILTSKKRVVVISGPNAGGKTVALKTLGLSVLLFEMGFPLPSGEGALIPYFKHVYADIGDNQSLAENLSTFSAHIASLASITRNIGGKDLLLLDEVGTGTSPNEGEALAKAILDYIVEKHSYAFLSSHFEGVKQYALGKDGVQNASMIFDTETLSPTYVLSFGTVGESFGLEIAKNYGLDQKIIERATQYREEGQDKTLGKAMKELSALSKEASKAKEELASRLQEIEKKERKLKSKEHALKNKEEKLLSVVEKKKEKMLQDAQKEIEDALYELRSPDVKLHEVIKAKKKLENLVAKGEVEQFDETISIGDYVSLPSLGIEGKVVSLTKKSAEIIDSKGFRFKADPSSLHKISAPKESMKEAMKPAVLDNLGYGKSLSMELNIIGQYADEARLSLERYLDACRLKGFHRVRIIHGFGTGALRKMTIEYLKKHPEFVDHYEGAGEAEGAGGATIVYLK